MTYLLPCPYCGSKIPVQPGQAGQMWPCSCGKQVEVPSVRHLRQLEIAVENEASAPMWTFRQGMTFVGIAIIVVAALAAGAIAVLRPSMPDKNSFVIEIDRDPIRREVESLSPAQEDSRLETVAFMLPGYAEELAHRLVPSHLQPCVSLLAAFEAEGPQPLTPKATAELSKKASKLSSEIHALQDTRRSMNDWLWLVGIVAVIGIFLACLPLILPAPAKRRVMAASRR